MKNKYITLPFLILLVACNSKEKSNVDENIIQNVEITTKENNAIINEEVIIVRNFIKWYKNNMTKLNQFNTIEGGMAVSENETPTNYSINFNEVEKYLSELSKSDFFTKEFIAQEKQTYVEGDVYFKENPENDGPPFGFDYDHFFMTQDEFELDMENVDKIDFTTKNIDKNNSEVQFNFPICGMKYKYLLKKENLIWRIDKIENISTQE